MNVHSLLNITEFNLLFSHIINIMLAKLILVLSLATLAMSFAKEENELLDTSLNTGTNLLREFSKLVAEDPDKYSVDLKSLYKKYEIADKTEQAKSYLQSQFKKGAELTNEYLKKKQHWRRRTTEEVFWNYQKGRFCFGRKINEILRQVMWIG